MNFIVLLMLGSLSIISLKNNVNCAQSLAQEYQKILQDIQNNKINDDLKVYLH